MAQRQSFGRLMVATAQDEWGRIKEADEWRKRFAAQLAEQRATEIAANATEQTVKRLSADVLERMLDRQQMTSEQHRAAVEIARVWEAITKRLFATTMRFGDVCRGAEADLPPGLNIAYAERYAPWRDEQGRLIVFRRLSACELVFHLAVDNLGPRQLANIYRVDHRTVKNAVCESLYRYAEIAGWIEDKNPTNPGTISSVVEAA